MNIPYIIVGIFALIGVFVLIKFFIFLYFLFNHKYKQLTREKITIKLKNKYNVTKKEYGGGMLGNLIGGFIVIIVGINLISNVQNQVNQINVGNVTGAASTILGLTPLFFALGIMAAGIALAMGGLRNSGLI